MIIKAICRIALSFILKPCFSQISFCGEVFPLENRTATAKLSNSLKKNRQGLSSIKKKLFLLDFFSLKLKEYGLPDDLKFIPIVESRLNKMDKSKAGATGIWQLMPGDATDFGLRIGNLDERNSIIRSTDAACREFTYLYKHLHNWMLVCAAYNFGLGNINKAIRKQGNDYFKMQLNEETGGYVYEAISFKMIYEKAFGIKYNKQNTLSKLQLPLNIHDNLSKPVSFFVKALISPNTEISQSGSLDIVLLDSMAIEGKSWPAGFKINCKVYEIGNRIKAAASGSQVSSEFSDYKIELYSKQKEVGLNGDYAFDGIKTDEKGLIIYLLISKLNDERNQQ